MKQFKVSVLDKLISDVALPNLKSLLLSDQAEISPCISPDIILVNMQFKHVIQEGLQPWFLTHVIKNVKMEQNISSNKG